MKHLNRFFNSVEWARLIHFTILIIAIAAGIMHFYGEPVGLALVKIIKAYLVIVFLVLMIYFFDR